MTRASPMRKQKREKIMHCHKRIKTVAIELARATYEGLMSSSNEVYANWKKRYPELSDSQREQKFVAHYWGSHIDAARATLARLLTEPIDEAMKEEIQEVLILDATLMRGRRDPATVLGAMK